MDIVSNYEFTTVENGIDLKPKRTFSNLAYVNLERITANKIKQIDSDKL